MSAVLVLSETLQPREAKELVTIVLKDLQFESVILHQESLAALFGNNMTSACIVSLGAQVCSVACIEVRERGGSLFSPFRFF
jgi:actin-related protein 8